MLTLNVYNRQGDTVGTMEVDPADFGGEINRQLLHDVVLMHLANQRSGTHSTLRRGEVAGSTKKLFRQKGTGRARRGTRRTNKVRGGGTSKGPKPRDYYYRLPKKAIRAATRMALLSKLQDQETIVLDSLKLEEIKTRPVAEVLKALKLQDTTCLLSTSEYDRNLYLSARNIEGVEIMPAAQLNAYLLLKQKRLVITRDALERLSKAGRKDAEGTPDTEAASGAQA